MKVAFVEIDRSLGICLRPVAGTCAADVDDHDVTHQPVPEERTDRRQKQGKSHDIGEEAGDQQQDAGDHDHRCIEYFLARRVALLAGLAQPREHAEPLDAHQHEAGDGLEHDQRQGGKKADAPSDENEAGDLRQRQQENEEGNETSQHGLHCRTDSRGPILPAPIARALVAFTSSPFE